MKDLIQYNIGGRTIELHTNKCVFYPTSTTVSLFEACPALDGKSVLDLGCGLGPIAIAAVLNGASQVIASDVMAEACDLTKRNALLNRVNDKVTVIESDIFRSLKNYQFDIIISDVSGMADGVARLSPWFPHPIPTGGQDGTDMAIAVLRDAEKYLVEGGQLIFPVLSLSRSEKILAAAEAAFPGRITQLIEKKIPFHNVLIQNMDLINMYKNNGIIDFELEFENPFWKLSIFSCIR